MNEMAQQQAAAETAALRAEAVAKKRDVDAVPDAFVQYEKACAQLAQLDFPEYEKQTIASNQLQLAVKLKKFDDDVAAQKIRYTLSQAAAQAKNVHFGVGPWGISEEEATEYWARKAEDREILFETNSLSDETLRSLLARQRASAQAQKAEARQRVMAAQKPTDLSDYSIGVRSK